MFSVFLAPFFVFLYLINKIAVEVFPLHTLTHWGKVSTNKNIGNFQWGGGCQRGLIETEYSFFFLQIKLFQAFNTVGPYNVLNHDCKCSQNNVTFFFFTKVDCKCGQHFCRSDSCEDLWWNKINIFRLWLFKMLSIINEKLLNIMWQCCPFFL